MPDQNRASLGVLFLALLPIAGRLAGQQGAEGRTISITVTDSKGAPAARVPLQLGHLGSMGDGLDYHRIGNAVTTDGKGTAVLAVPLGTNADGLHVQALVVAEPPVRQSLAALPASTTLQLPPCGQVRVLVYDDAEHPRRGVTFVSLRIAGNKRFFDHVDAPGAAEAEGAMFPWVALGLPLEARATVEGSNGFLSVKKAGPLHAGELVVIELRQRAVARLRARLIGLDGKPVVSARLGLLVRRERSVLVDAATTDAEGVYRFLLPDGLAGADNASLLLLRRGEGNRGYLGAVSIPLADAWQGERDLGELQLRAEVPVFKGRLVDEAGKPVGGVRVTAELAASEGWVGREVRERHGWQHDLTTDAEGRFELRELEPTSVRLPLEVHGDWLVPGQLTVPCGDEPVDVKVVRPARLRLQLVGVPEGTQVLGVNLEQPEEVMRNGPGHFPDQKNLTVGADGVLEFTRLRPGRYSLGIGLGLTTPPFKLEDLEVPAGGECTDARLRCSDWSGTLRLVTVRVLDAAGAPVRAQVQVYEVRTYGVSGLGVPCRPEQPLHLLIPKDRRLLLQQRGMCSQVVLDPPAEVVFRLRPRPDVRIVVKDGQTLPAGLRVQVRSSMVDFLQGEGVEAVADGKAEVALRAEALGAATVVLSVPQGNGTHAQAWSGPITVGEGTEPQRIELALEAKQLEAIRALIKAR